MKTYSLPHMCHEPIAKVEKNCKIILYSDYKLPINSRWKGQRTCIELGEGEVTRGLGCLGFRVN
jgi:hypothetical protein